MLGDVIHPLTALLAVRADPDLDQFVVIEGVLDFSHDVVVQPFVTHHHHRVELVGEPSQVAQLPIIERHVAVWLWHTVAEQTLGLAGRRF